jgi:hypothetical protein
MYTCHKHELTIYHKKWLVLLIFLPDGYGVFPLPVVHLWFGVVTDYFACNGSPYLRSSGVSRRGPCVNPSAHPCISLSPLVCRLLRVCGSPYLYRDSTFGAPGPGDSGATMGEVYALLVPAESPTPSSNGFSLPP